MQRDMAVIGLPSETSLGKVEPGFVVSWKKVSNASKANASKANSVPSFRAWCRKVTQAKVYLLRREQTLTIDDYDTMTSSS